MRKWWAECAGVTVGPVQRVRWTGSERARAQNARAAGSVHTRARTSSRRFDSTHPRTHTQARKGSRANAASTDVVVVSTGRRRYGGDGGFRKIIVFGKKKNRNKIIDRTGPVTFTTSVFDRSRAPSSINDCRTNGFVIFIVICARIYNIIIITYVCVCVRVRVRACAWDREPLSVDGRERQRNDDGARRRNGFIGRPLHHLWPSVKSMRSWTSRRRRRSSIPAMGDARALSSLVVYYHGCVIPSLDAFRAAAASV